MKINRGQTTEVRVRFRRDGGVAHFVVPPRWTVYTPLDEVVVSGIGVANGDEWSAQVTIPSTYVPLSDNESLLLQFSGRDSKNTDYKIERELTLTDDVSDWKPDVVLYNQLIDATLTTTFSSPTPLREFNAVFVDPTGNVLATQVNANPTATSQNAYGYEYAVDFGTPTTMGYPHPDPYQIIVKTTATNGVIDSHALSTYVVTPGMPKLINSLRMYLDKARLRDIEPSLEWHVAEFVHFVHEGIKEVNAAAPAATFWTTENFPSSLQPYLNAAAALHALRARHLAEGLNAFQFQGSNTQLEFNRAEVLQSHIDMMNTKIDTLPTAKRAAIKTFGHGTPPPGTVSQRIANLGTTAITANLVNRHRIHRSGRMLFR